MNINLDKARQAAAQRRAEGLKNSTPLDKWATDKQSLRKSVNAFCFSCVGEVKKEVTNCSAYNCPLWHVRPYQRSDKNEMPEL